MGLDRLDCESIPLPPLIKRVKNLAQVWNFIAGNLRNTFRKQPLAAIPVP